MKNLSENEKIYSLPEELLTTADEDEVTPSELSDSDLNPAFMVSEDLEV